MSDGTVHARAQIDKLGIRLRTSEPLETDDLVMLDEYRRSLSTFSNTLTSELRNLLDTAITERPGKSTLSIVAKLKRQTVALSRMQDIAGGRLVVPHLAEQNVLASRVVAHFAKSRLIDRREKPVAGYHAVHAIIQRGSLAFELQIRTQAQHRWAQLSEKFADLVGFEIKYGGGPEPVRRFLESFGESIYANELQRLTAERVRRVTQQVIDAESQVAALDKQYVRKHSQQELLTIDKEIVEASGEMDRSFSEAEELLRMISRKAT